MATCRHGSANITQREGSKWRFEREQCNMSRPTMMIVPCVRKPQVAEVCKMLFQILLIFNVRSPGCGNSRRWHNNYRLNQGKYIILEILSIIYEYILSDIMGYDVSRQSRNHARNPRTQTGRYFVDTCWPGQQQELCLLPFRRAGAPNLPLAKSRNLHHKKQRGAADTRFPAGRNIVQPATCNA